MSLYRLNCDDFVPVTGFADGKLAAGNGRIMVRSEPFTSARYNIFSHFKALARYKSTFSVQGSVAFDVLISGDQYLPDSRDSSVLKASPNIANDPRLCCGGFLLAEPHQNVIMGILVTRQTIYAITGRHPLPPLARFCEWCQHATLDDYVQLIAYEQWRVKKRTASGESDSWAAWYKNYYVPKYTGPFREWQRKCTEPTFWLEWWQFRHTCTCMNNMDMHLGLVELYERASPDEEILASIVVNSAGAVQWFLNGCLLFSQPRAGVRLLSKYQAVDTGALNEPAPLKQLVPLLGTFAWLDFILPETKCDPLVALQAKYFNVVPNRLGQRCQLPEKAFTVPYVSPEDCKSKEFVNAIISAECKSESASTGLLECYIPEMASSKQLFGQGAYISISRANFGRACQNNMLAMPTMLATSAGFMPDTLESGQSAALQQEESSEESSST